MAKQVKRSPAPLYCAAAVWLGWGLLLPLYRLPHILAAATLSAVAGLIGKSLFPDKTYDLPGEKEEKAKEPETPGNPELDAQEAKRYKAMS